MQRRLVKSLWLIAWFVIVGVQGGASTLGEMVQSSRGNASVYVTSLNITTTADGYRSIALNHSGRVLKLLDVALGLFTTLAGNLQYPTDILCGANGKLYVIDEDPFGSSRVLRINQDGTATTVVAQWSGRGNLIPQGLTFAPNGDLYFGTTSMTLRDESGTIVIPEQGIWRIQGALQADRTFNPPEQVVKGGGFGSTTPYTFLTAGPFSGDLVLIRDGKVLRASQSSFSSVVDFIPWREEGRAQGLVTTADGELLVAYTGTNDVLLYEPDGTLKATFTQLASPNQITVDANSTVYITIDPFSSNGGLFTFDSTGHSVASADFPLHLWGVTACMPR